MTTSILYFRQSGMSSGSMARAECVSHVCTKLEPAALLMALYIAW
jgi:hypothetical protein